MEEEVKIGVYICHCGLNIAGTVDSAGVARYAATLPHVVIARDYKYMCSDPGQDLIKNDIKELGINRVVVASCSPRMHELTFRKAVEAGGLNPYLYEHANIREHCSWVHDDKKVATSKAKDLVRAAVKRVYHHEPLVIKEAPLNPNVLIVGGGIAGMQAALDIANGQKKVYMVEREPSIGGHMIQLDRTFPTLDCSECILTPKMSDVGHHPFIELLSLSEVEEVSGSIGNFKVKVRKKARYVDESKCVGCGICEEKCPRRTDSEFEMGLAKRGMAYIPFAQAIPHIATIDKRVERPCKAACRAACPIHMNTLGYISLIKEGKFEEAYEVIRRTNPLPAICGRVCYAPCEQACNRGQIDDSIATRELKRFAADYAMNAGRDKARPVEITKEEKVAIVGSGPAGLACAHELIRQGYPVTIFEAAPEAGGLLRYGIPEYRLPKEVLSSDISYIQEMGVEIKTNTTVKGLDELFKQGYKAIFLGTGAWDSQKMGIPGEDSPGVLYVLDFLKQVNSGVKVRLGPKVAIIGGGNAAADAARVARRLGVKEVTVVYRRTRTEMPAIPSEVEQMEQEGVTIQFLAVPVEVLSKDNRVTGIKCARMEMGEPDAKGRRRPRLVQGSEFTIDVDSVIMAIGQSVDKSALPEGLTFTDLGTLDVDPATLRTNIDGVFAGGDVVSGPADVILAIAAGKRAARSMNAYLRGEELGTEEWGNVEKLSEEEVAEIKKRFDSRNRVERSTPDLGKRVSDFEEVEQAYSPEEAQQEAGRCLASAIEGCFECGECKGACEAGAIDYDQTDQIVELEVGLIIVATGYDQFDPSVIPQYGYRKYDNVLTGLEFERITCAAGPTEGKILLKDGREPASVAIVHCVGSRDQNYHEYCSRVCCMYGLKYAHLIKEFTKADVYEFYIDMRCFGEGYEEFYKRNSEEGVNFIRGKVAKITDEALTDEEKGKLIVVSEDTLLGKLVRVPVDMVILCSALEARSDADDVARLFVLNRRADGFFLERHVKLDPVATPTDGVFIAGCCEGPRDIPDTVAQAEATAAKALSLISKGTVTLEAAVSTVDESICQGCGRCEEVCTFHAPKVTAKNGTLVSTVNETLCKGCGACAVVCPTGAISIKHFTQDEILAQVAALTEVS
jgi:heterodisulfide reductase subunit A